MKKAFTMIELIFVIVIIGILAAVAIPKLAATRSDAEGATIVSSLASCIGEAGNEYMMEGTFHHWTQDDNHTANCAEAKKCFSFTENDSNGTLDIVYTNITLKKCTEAQRISDNNLLSSAHSISF